MKKAGSISDFLEENRWKEKGVYTFHVFKRISKRSFVIPVFAMVVQNKETKQVVTVFFIILFLSFPPSLSLVFGFVCLFVCFLFFCFRKE
jgi:hypothetical protein